MGNFDLLDVLASLAYEGRRRAMFEAEFVTALRLIDQAVPRERLIGSYAGATGFPQFMPSAVLRLRTDGDGDGIADIWTNEIDALASVASYLREAGSKPDLPWGARAAVPASLDRSAILRNSEVSRCSAVSRLSRTLTIGQWRKLGVQTLGPKLADDVEAALLAPVGEGELAYLVTPNFLSLLAYNCSNAYALSVALTADAIARR